MQVHVAKAELAVMPVDALVIPANSLGIMGSGVGGAVRRRGGDVIQQESMALAPIAVGAAIVTSAGRLHAKHIIHAPIMEDPGTKIGVENVRRATRAALIAAAVQGYQVVALPGIGTAEGDGAIDRDEAARAIVDELRAHRQALPSTIWLVDGEDDMLRAFDDALRNAQQGL